MVKSINNSNGASIVAVIFILSILVAIGVIFVAMFSTGVEQATGEVSSSRALYAAEAGLQSAIGHLKKTPVSTNWVWKEGYLGKSAGSGTADVEVLEYENRDSTLVGANKCEPFKSKLESAGVNPARTVLVTLSWDSAANLGLELYDNTVADCNNPLGSANLIASSLTANKPETIRYRIQTAPPATLIYTARVTGTAGDVYRLRVSHPDEVNFSTANQCGDPAGPPLDECMRAVIALGKVNNARREVFAGFKRTP